MVQAKLHDAGIDSRIFTDIEAEPSVETIKQGADAMQSYRPDWIVGLGRRVASGCGQGNVDSVRAS